MKAKKCHFHYKSLIALAFVLIVSVSAMAQPGRPESTKSGELNRDQARVVLSTYLKSQGYKTNSPHFDLEDDPDIPNMPVFYTFHAYYDSPNRLVSIGTYAVNRKTADLWERLACKQVKSKSLKLLQESLRKRLGSSISNTKPSDAEPCS